MLRDRNRACYQSSVVPTSVYLPRTVPTSLRILCLSKPSCPISCSRTLTRHNTVFRPPTHRPPQLRRMALRPLRRQRRLRLHQRQPRRHLLRPDQLSIQEVACQTRTFPLLTVRRTRVEEDLGVSYCSELCVAYWSVVLLLRFRGSRRGC